MSKTADNKIAISSFEQVIRDDFDDQDTLLDWHGLNIHIKHTISFGKMLAFVQDVAELCFADESGEYIPQVQQFGFRCSVLDYYTNIELPKNLTKRYDMVFKTDIFENVVPYINDVQLGDISHSITEKVRQIAGMGISNIHNEVLRLIDKFNDMQDNLENVMKDISPDMLETFMGLVRGESESEASKEVPKD